MNPVGSGCVKERWKYHLIALADLCVPPNPSIHLSGTLALVSAHIQNCWAPLAHTNLCDSF